jgi:hypothetical protein
LTGGARLRQAGFPLEHAWEEPMTVDERRSSASAHPFLVAYLAAFVAVWVFSVVTWTARPGSTPELHPVAQVLQYVLAAVAATLAALRLRVQPPEMREGAGFQFYDLHWEVNDDVGGQAFWTAIAVGAAAMIVNVVLLAVADVAVGGGSAGFATYLGWIGSAMAAGAILGLFSTLVALAIATVVRRVRR